MFWLTQRWHRRRQRASARTPRRVDKKHNQEACHQHTLHRHHRIYIPSRTWVRLLRHPSPCRISLCRRRSHLPRFPPRATAVGRPAASECVGGGCCPTPVSPNASCIPEKWIDAAEPCKAIAPSRRPSPSLPPAPPVRAPPPTQPPRPSAVPTAAAASSGEWHFSWWLSRPAPISTSCTAAFWHPLTPWRALIPWPVRIRWRRRGRGNLGPPATGVGLSVAGTVLGPRQLEEIVSSGGSGAGEAACLGRWGKRVQVKSART